MLNKSPSNGNKKMSVLVGIYSLDHVGGAETYTCDLIKQLRSRDEIEVEFFAIKQGRLCDYLRDDLGVPFMRKEKYDLILVTHNVTVEALYGKGPIVQICHGAIMGLEFPSVYADFHVGISKEVCDSLERKGFDSVLVLNGLDLQQKRPERPLNPQLKKVLSLCQSEEANSLLRDVCRRLGVGFTAFNKHKNPTFHIEREINDADLVVGIGRSVYDAMACGRPCIVFDSRDYNGNKGDGYLHPHLFNVFVEANCSGRYRNRHFSEDELIVEFTKYRPGDGERLRAIAEEQLDVAKTTDALLSTLSLISAKTRRKKRYRIFKARFRRLRKAFKRQLKRAIGVNPS
ncbi:hypothetical protein [Parapedobacter soli]|uniref:hypothetical protein n=1 Tax=Parapedobacter soli TaxID=416955 RepID=UPI0021C65F3C|nr:hypothetical protein [Parapedobacter soli]